MIKNAKLISLIRGFFLRRVRITTLTLPPSPLPVSNPARLGHSLPPQVRPVRAQVLDDEGRRGGRRQRAEVLNWMITVG